MKKQRTEAMSKRKKYAIILVGIILIFAALSGMNKHNKPAQTPPLKNNNNGSAQSEGVLRLTIDTRFRGCATRPAIALKNPDATIDWGDGSAAAEAQDGINRHSYPKGEYKITVKGTFERLGSGELNQDVGLCFKSLDEWTAGTAATSAESAFSNAVHMVSAVQPPKTVTSYKGMFSGSTLFNGDITAWDVSTVSDMSLMFSNASNFNQNIGNWNTSSVTDMSDMFSGAADFNQNIGRWNVSKVKTMEGMFSRASAFNQNIGSWDTSEVVQMCTMFSRADNFNQDIGMWDVKSVKSMTSMFKDARSMSANLTAWNVNEVEGNYREFRSGNTLMVEPNWTKESKFNSSC